MGTLIGVKAEQAGQTSLLIILSQFRDECDLLPGKRDASKIIGQLN